MKKNKKDILIFSLIGLFIFIIISITIINQSLSPIIITTFNLIILVITYLLFGMKKNITTILDKKVTNYLLIYFLIYYVIIYLIGLITGYEYNNLRVNITNMSFYFLSLFLIEITRYILINKDNNTKRNIVIITIITSLINILFLYSLINLNLIVIISIIINNLFLTYLSLYFGYKIALIYCFLLDGLIVAIPIIPKINLSVLSFFTIILIFIVYHNLKKIYNFYNHIITNKKFVSKKYRLIYIPFFLIFCSFLILVSKEFDYYLIAIASNSMSPKLNRGDAIIVKKVSKENNLSLNDIVVFENDKKKIIHRIINVIEKDHKLYYQTKGDNNKEADKIYLEIKEIEGKVSYRIPYLAFPTVKIREIFKK